MNNLSIKEYLTKFNNGNFDSSFKDVQISAGWYDWFCRNTSLKNKTIKLTAKLKSILPTTKFDIEKTYVFFKNNCPFYGNLYDDFRICDLETGNVIFTIVPSSGHKKEKGQSQIWGKENNFEKPLVVGKWKDVVMFFKNN